MKQRLRESTCPAHRLCRRARRPSRASAATAASRNLLRHASVLTAAPGVRKQLQLSLNNPLSLTKRWLAHRQSSRSHCRRLTRRRLTRPRLIRLLLTRLLLTRLRPAMVSKVTVNSLTSSLISKVTNRNIPAEFLMRRRRRPKGVQISLARLL